MKRPNWCSVAILGTLLAIPYVTRAAPAAGGFQLYTEREEIPERGEVTACVLLTQGCRFRFLPPVNWSIKSEATNLTVVLTPADLSAAILLVLHPGTNSSPPALDADQLRQRVLERYPKARLMREYTCNISGVVGPAFDLVNDVPGDGQAALGFVFLPYAGGMASFEARTTRDCASTTKRHLSWVLSSLRIEPVTTKPTASVIASGRPARPTQPMERLPSPEE